MDQVVKEKIHIHQRNNECFKRNLIYCDKMLLLSMKKTTYGTNISNKLAQTEVLILLKIFTWSYSLFISAKNDELKKLLEDGKVKILSIRKKTDTELKEILCVFWSIWLILTNKKSYISRHH